MSEETEELPFEGCCDLIERELRNALQDITYIRENRPEAKRRCFLLRVALANARHYLLELERNLWSRREADCGLTNRPT